MNKEFSNLIKDSFREDGSINNEALKELLVDIINSQEELYYQTENLRDDLTIMELGS